MTPHTYILNASNEPVIEKDLFAWAKWMEGDQRLIKQDTLNGIKVSTVFLALDHQWGEGAPLLLETMIFGGTFDNCQERCSTYAESLKLHDIALDIVKNDEHTNRSSATEP